MQIYLTGCARVGWTIKADSMLAWVMTGSVISIHVMSEHPFHLWHLTLLEPLFVSLARW